MSSKETSLFLKKVNKIFTDIENLEIPTIASINGAALGFANVVERGPIGVIAAAGTGVQEVTTLIHQAGSGISHAIGTGGRDLYDDIGGIMMSKGVQMLEKDAETKVIVLISKPPGPKTQKTILETNFSKPVVVCLSLIHI